MGCSETMVVQHAVPAYRLRIKYACVRAYKEGWSLALWQRNMHNLLRRIGALIINPFRFLVTWDLNHVFRMIVSVAYIVTFLKGGYRENRN